jgi:hypothetical protein
VAILILGCGGNGSNDNSATTPTAPATAQVAGTYVATFSGAEGADKAGRGPEPGRWALRIRPPKTMGATYVKQGFGFALGEPVKISGRNVTFGPTMLCRAQSSEAKYRAAPTTGGVRFAKVSESCDARAAFLTTHPWKRVSNDPEAKVN